MSAGGSMSNLYSVLLSRYNFYPEVKMGGMSDLPRLALFTSEHVILSVPSGLAVI